MTQDDFEALTALDAVKYGRVHIELQCLGFCIIARRKITTWQENRKIVTYADAFNAKNPLQLFQAAIAATLEELGHT